MRGYASMTVTTPAVASLTLDGAVPWSSGYGSAHNVGEVCFERVGHLAGNGRLLLTVCSYSGCVATFADLIEGPLAHLPSGHFGANAAWLVCAAICHNLLRAAGTMTSTLHAAARGATLRRQLICVPARLARPQDTPVLHLPAHWPWSQAWMSLHTATTGPPSAA